MRRSPYSPIILSAAMTTFAMAAVAEAAEPVASPPPPGQGRASKPSPAYQAQTPVTEADHERIRLAAERRARKVARQAKGFAQ